jgi:hypothetical protein
MFEAIKANIAKEQAAAGGEIRDPQDTHTHTQGQGHTQGHSHKHTGVWTQGCGVEEMPRLLGARADQGRTGGLAVRNRVFFPQISDGVGTECALRPIFSRAARDIRIGSNRTAL